MALLEIMERVRETPGDRLFQIRAACGNGTRDPEPLKAFVRRVKERTEREYDPTTVSLLERMKQNWRLEDVRTFAAVDPLERGEVWLSALGQADAPEVEMPDPLADRKLNQHEIGRAKRQAETETRQQAKPKKVRKRPGGRP